MSFSGDVGKFKLDAMKATEKTSRGTSIALWRAVILDSPVDSGRFRGNWFASSGAPSDVTTAEVDSQGVRTVAKAAQFVQSTNDWQSLWLSNNLPYSERLEFGYSSQAPEGMVRKNIARFQTIINEEANKNSV